MRRKHFTQRLLVILALLVIFACKIHGQFNLIYPKDTDGQSLGQKCKRKDGTEGICKSAVNCRELANRLDLQICSFKKQQPLYCCNDPVEKFESDDQSSPRLVEQLCEEFYPKDAINTLVVGGNRSLPQQHPHMAALGWRNFDGGLDWRCGGAVISRKFIITAAHCTKQRGAKPDIARTGDLDLVRTESNTFPVDYNIVQVYSHPEYKSSSTYHDIGLLKISPDFKTSLRIKPACLWTSNSIPNKELTALGYGTLEYGGPDAKTLYEVNLPLLSDQNCRARIPTAPSLSNGLISGQICTWDPNGEKDTCQGDSGGPLQFTRIVKKTSRIPTIVGITSFGHYCASAIPSVYTRVSSYLDWIESIIRRNES